MINNIVLEEMIKEMETWKEFYELMQGELKRTKRTIYSINNMVKIRNSERNTNGEKWYPPTKTREKKFKYRMRQIFF